MILRVRDAEGNIREIVVIRGPKGEKGTDGTMTFEDLTDAQKESLKGDTGVGIASVQQTTTSSADGGTNVLTVTLTDGTGATFSVKNGSKGSAGVAGANGEDGYTPVKGTDYWTASDKAEIVAEVLANFTDVSEVGL